MYIKQVITQSTFFFTIIDAANAFGGNGDTDVHNDAAEVPDGPDERIAQWGLVEKISKKASPAAPARRLIEGILTFGIFFFLFHFAR